MQNIKIISGNLDFLNNLKSKNVLFNLVGSYTETCEIKGISSAGLPNKLEYTPPADMEALYYGKARCLQTMPEAPLGPPSPVIIGLAVKNILDFDINFIDAGLKIKPDLNCVDLGVNYSKSILSGSGVPVEYLLKKGKDIAKNNLSYDIELVAECVPGGTTTAYSLCKSLGYKCDNMFSSSSVDKNHMKLKKETVDFALNKFGIFNNSLNNCKYYGDNMQPFVAAYAAEKSLSKPVVLAGGTQMLAVYALMKEIFNNANFDNISVMTTKWVVEDSNSDFIGLAKLIDENMNIFYANFSMDSDIENLKLYEKGMVKEGVGAGALLTYSFVNNIKSNVILTEVENIYKKLFKN